MCFKVQRCFSSSFQNNPLPKAWAHTYTQNANTHTNYVLRTTTRQRPSVHFRGYFPFWRVILTLVYWERYAVFAQPRRAVPSFPVWVRVNLRVMHSPAVFSRLQRCVLWGCLSSCSLHMCVCMHIMYKWAMPDVPMPYSHFPYCNPWKYVPVSSRNWTHAGKEKKNQSILQTTLSEYLKETTASLAKSRTHALERLSLKLLPFNVLKRAFK